ncbi:tyrosine-type recombinase/integrase [Vibrio hannami]|uniref:tyrosine-type recombinase/integrase n=1 Tax=Vibrio hannami TaxID=2717094 RepID=UPI002410746A|nr:tyrosine-type recombinase/integrase [Vibrio hannami]MDG3085461.1 tyrosine-type recombinase/integrase [Vibrio hannami]
MVIKQLELEKNGDARQANAFTNEHLSQLDNLMKRDNSPQAYRDLAIYYLMFECALKRSELRYLELESVKFDHGQAVVSVGDNRYALSGNASNALCRWLDLLPGKGICFRRIDKHGNIGEDALDDSSIYRVMRRASDKLGLSEEMRFTAQSPRVGAARALKLQGHDLKGIQEFGRWLSPAMPAQYLNFQSTSDTEKSKFKTIRPWI